MAPRSVSRSRFSSARLRVVVAGGGAFGLTSALSLARRGGEVTLCDPARLGDNASGVAAGMLAPAFEALLDPPSKDHFSILSAARSAWPAFAAGLGLALEREGALWAGPDAEAVEARLAHQGARARRLSPIEAMTAAPGLKILSEAVFTPEDWRLDVAEALLALRSAAATAGVRFVDQAVAEFVAGAVRLSDGGRIGADRLVVAVGAASSGLAPELSRLSPVKGHILRMAGGPRQGPVVRAEKIYIRPHPAGAVVGASMELGRSDRDVDPAIVADLVARAASLFPDLAGAPYHVATGVRATTEDGLPLVGRSERPDVLLAIGARRNGWLLAPAVGEAVAAAALGEAPGGPGLFDRV